MIENPSLPPPCVQVLDQHGETLQVIEIISAGITVGCLPTGDLILNHAAVARRHLRIEWDGNDITVIDLGAPTGTLLDGCRLPPHTRQPWAAQQVIRVGPFQLRRDQRCDLSRLAEPRVRLLPERKTSGWRAEVETAL